MFCRINVYDLITGSDRLLYLNDLSRSAVLELAKKGYYTEVRNTMHFVQLLSTYCISKKNDVNANNLMYCRSNVSLQHGMCVH